MSHRWDFVPKSRHRGPYLYPQGPDVQIVNTEVVPTIRYVAEILSSSHTSPGGDETAHWTTVYSGDDEDAAHQMCDDLPGDLCRVREWWTLPTGQFSVRSVGTWFEIVRQPSDPESCFLFYSVPYGDGQQSIVWDETTGQIVVSFNTGSIMDPGLEIVAVLQVGQQIVAEVILEESGRTVRIAVQWTGIDLVETKSLQPL